MRKRRVIAAGDAGHNPLAFHAVAGARNKETVPSVLLLSIVIERGPGKSRLTRNDGTLDRPTRSTTAGNDRTVVIGEATTTDHFWTS